MHLRVVDLCMQKQNSFITQNMVQEKYCAADRMFAAQSKVILVMVYMSL